MATCAAGNSARSGWTSLTSFRVWLERAAPGSCLEYHRGFLSVDRTASSPLSPRQRDRLARLADLAFEAAERGRVHLVQRRQGSSDFSYLAVKVRGPFTGSNLMAWQLAGPDGTDVILPLAA
jgi:hypothetical protein